MKSDLFPGKYPYKGDDPMFMFLKSTPKYQSHRLQIINIKWAQNHQGINPQAICSFDSKQVKTKVRTEKSFITIWFIPLSC